jgi:Flp pilus assembly protein TadG
MMSFVLFVLLGSAAMAVDFGWLFWQSIEIQHAADAAGLAGVV